MPVLTAHWSPHRPAVEYAESLADGKALVVELGPGNRPFRPATDFVGRCVQTRDGSYKGRWHQLNLSNDSLPWGDGEVDFIYARHVIEDLDDAEWCLSEIRRVAKAGYIETPSPVAEMCRGVDAERKLTGTRPPWRGYHHHRSFVWDAGGALHLVGKFPFVEHIDMGLHEESLCDLLNSGPLYWNTYFAWTGPLEYRVWRHEVDFDVGPAYGELLDRAVKCSVESAGRFGT